MLDSEAGFSFLVIYFTSNDFRFFFFFGGPFMKVGTFFVLVLWIVDTKFGHRFLVVHIRCSELIEYFLFII